MSETPSKSPSRQSLIMAFVLILVIVQGINLYFHFKSRKENEVQATELTETRQQLQDISMELDQKIAQIQNVGGDVDELKQIRAQLEAEKDELGRTNRLNYKRYMELKDKLEGYEELLVLKDQEINQLKNINQELLSENKGLKTEKNRLNDSLSSLSQSKTQLEEKVQLAGKLYVENIKVVAVTAKGREREGEFKKKHIDQLKVSFRIRKNDVAPIGARQVLLRIVDPNGKALFDLDKGSGTFELEGKELFYTLSQEIVFTNSQQEVIFNYTKGSDYELEGTYQVEFYTDGYLMGSSSFLVR
ncbi:MAG: chromosome segregation protein SMC [Cytophagales bacterium]|nr:chromosome segregation protein SMC [Cytophagales bacterium]